MLPSTGIKKRGTRFGGSNVGIPDLLDIASIALKNAGRGSELVIGIGIPDLFVNPGWERVLWRASVSDPLRSERQI